jgi:hypothetical protein
MAKFLVMVVWVVALALVGWGEAEHWRLLVRQLTIVTGAVAVGMLALGIGGIVYYGAGIVRLS